MDWENQKMTEEFFNKRQTPKLLRREILNSDFLIKKIQESELNEEFAIELLSIMILYKRTKVQQMVGMLRGHFKTLQLTADAIRKAAEKDLMDYDPVKDQFVIRYDIDEHAMSLIRQYQYMPPMIVPPLTVKDNRGSGYITIRTDSLILKNNHHDGDICLDSINKFNNIPLSININVVKSIRNQWKNIDKPKAGESLEDYGKRVKAFERYEKDSFFTIALMEQYGNRFWLTHKVDKRGRTYSQGYHINPQGNCWNKACVEFADKELVL